MYQPKQPLGTVGWFDLTVPDADRVRDFYSAVVGWKAEGVDMGGYQDYCMSPPGGSHVGGVCHAKGPNTGIPPAWLIYIIVADAQASADQAVASGGSIVRPVTSMGASGRMAILKDPAGAVFAVFEQA